MPETLIWEARCPHFRTMGDPCGTSGTPWETVVAAGRTCGGLESKFHWFWDDLGIPFWKLVGHRGSTIFFLSGLVSRSLFVTTSGCLGLLKQGSRIEVIPKSIKTTFAPKLNVGDFVSIFMFCWCPWVFFLWLLVPWDFFATPYGGTPELRERTSGVVDVLLPGP